MKLGQYSLEEFMQLAESFHGYAAPGVLAGAIMVEIAKKHIPRGRLHDVICESSRCLPDAVQLLTPCTTGNGWLKIIDSGRFAMTLFDKENGDGVRISINTDKLEEFEEIKKWFFKAVPKKEQDSRLLREQIVEAGEELYDIRKVRVSQEFLASDKKEPVWICRECGEAFVGFPGEICPGCKGESAYIEPNEKIEKPAAAPSFLKKIPVDEAVGKQVAHDMTEIVPGKSKGPSFKKGHIVSPGDICHLQKMGRENLYVRENKDAQDGWVHEDEAALAFARSMAGEGVSYTEQPSEGKASFSASIDGLFTIDENRLESFNMVPDVMCACRHNYSVVKKGEMLGGTRAIPLYIRRSIYEKALAALGDDHLFLVRPVRKMKFGALITGTEVFRGLIEDRFAPIIESKARESGCEVLKSMIVPDDREEITRGVKGLLSAGIDILVTTAGLSVDPDDVTRQGLIDAGAADILYGAPVLPGAMLLLARIGNVPLVGVPACALYYKRTVFDLVLPRILAGCEITRADLAKMGHGAFCLQCQSCTYPKCPFGR